MIRKLSFILKIYLLAAFFIAAWLFAWLIFSPHQTSYYAYKTPEVPIIMEPVVDILPTEAVAEEPIEPVETIEETLIEEPIDIYQEPVSEVEELEVQGYYVAEPIDISQEPVPVADNNVDTSEDDGYYGNGTILTPEGGVNYYNGRKETWYSQRVLPGGGLDIPGRHVDEAGLIRDEDGYICVAASDLEYGTVVETSLGTGKVYDTGCAPGTTDIYTDW